MSKRPWTDREIQNVNLRQLTGIAFWVLIAAAIAFLVFSVIFDVGVVTINAE